MNVQDVSAQWVALHEALGLGNPIADEDEYLRVLAFVDECFEQFGADEHHPIFALIDVVANRIREYEDRVHPWPDTSTPASVLASLMEDRGLRQSDLPEVGSQGVVSEVLSGKRALNARHIKALAKRFGVSAELFLA